jgi:hypothetical protein
VQSHDHEHDRIGTTLLPANHETGFMIARPANNHSSVFENYWDAVDIQQVIFPLPSDHRLLILVQYNVLRAIVTNMNILSLHRLSWECKMGHARMPLFDMPTEPVIPPSLLPTAIQKATPVCKPQDESTLHIRLTPSLTISTNLG